MKPSASLLGIASAIFCVAAFAGEVDGIVAQVGDSTILRSDVERERGLFASASDADFQTLLNRVIDRRLILKAAGNSKMTMQEWVVDNRIREIIDNGFDGDRNKLVAALAREKLPFAEFRQRIKDDLVVGAMRWNYVDKFVTASPAEMRAEYSAHPERYLTRATVTVSVILLRPDDAGRRDEVDEALKSEPFAEVARRYSADPHAKDGGVWKDVVPADSFREEIVDAIAKMKPGETSQWIDLGGWNFLVRKDAETPAAPRSFADAYEDIEAAVRKRRSQELYERWLDILKSETYIKVY